MSDVARRPLDIAMLVFFHSVYFRSEYMKFKKKEFLNLQINSCFSLYGVHIHAYFSIIYFKLVKSLFAHKINNSDFDFLS